MGKYLKAIVAALIAGLGSIATALGDNAISAQEWVTAGLAFLVALSAVWAVPNKGRGVADEAVAPPRPTVSH